MGQVTGEKHLERIGLPNCCRLLPTVANSLDTPVMQCSSVNLLALMPSYHKKKGCVDN